MGHDHLEAGSAEAVKLRVFSSPLLQNKPEDESDDEFHGVHENFTNSPQRDELPEFKRVSSVFH